LLPGRTYLKRENGRGGEGRKREVEEQEMIRGKEQESSKGERRRWKEEGEG